MKGLALPQSWQQDPCAVVYYGQWVWVSFLVSMEQDCVTSGPFFPVLCRHSLAEFCLAMNKCQSTSMWQKRTEKRQLEGISRSSIPLKTFRSKLIKENFMENRLKLPCRNLQSLTYRLWSLHSFLKLLSHNLDTGGINLDNFIQRNLLVHFCWLNPCPCLQRSTKKDSLARDPNSLLFSFIKAGKSTGGCSLLPPFWLLLEPQVQWAGGKPSWLEPRN